ARLLERIHEINARGEPRFRLFHETTAQGCVDLRAQRWVQTLSRRRLLRHNLVDHRREVFAGERTISGQHLESNHRQRKLVGASTNSIAMNATSLCSSMS